MPAWQFQEAQTATQTLIGADNNNNTQATTNVAANADGSVLERLETIQQAVGGTDGSTNILGADDADNGFASTNVVGNADGSIIERLEFLQAAAAGTVGLASFPAAAAPANDVSIAEAIRYIVEGQLTVPTADVSTNVDTADVVGNKTDAAVTTVGATSSVVAYAKGVLTDMLALPRCVEKSDGAVLSGADPLFTIAGGPVKILEITGIVTTTVGAGTTNAKLQIVTTTPAATVDMNAAAVDIDGDVAGTSYQTINTTGILTPVTAGYVKEANAFATLPTTFLAPIGSIQLTSDAARAGVIKWYLRYVPLSPLSRVTAAA